jgi:hypothetical protein
MVGILFQNSKNEHSKSVTEFLRLHSSLTHGAEKLPIVQPLKNFPAFYGTRRFITVFIRALH